MSEQDEKCCDIDIHIHNQGDVNIYNCSTLPRPPQPCPPSRPDGGVSTPPCGPGACVPLALGSKPKQSQQQKLARLLASTKVPSTLAAGIIQLLRRFAAGQAPANELEQGAFDRFRRIPESDRHIMSCIVAQFDGLLQADRNRLFNPSLPTDVDTPLSPKQLADEFLAEIQERIKTTPADDLDCLAPTPGKIRVYEPVGEDFFSQVRICQVNGLRTSNFIPQPDLSEYLPTELEQICVPELHGDQVGVVCSIQQGNCPGYSSATDNSCFKVFDVQTGDSVLVQGVNYFSTNATVELRGRAPLTEQREVPTFVCGDQDTPISETVNGETALINDCRVHDKLRFTVPIDLPPGIYEFDVKVPNVTNIASLGPFLTSNIEYLRVNVPSTARFKIVSEKLHCKDETSPAFFGNDEIGLTFLTTGLRNDGSFCELQSVQALRKDMDSGDTTDLTCVLLKPEDQDQPAPLVAITAVVIGYEIDDYDAYVLQIESWKAAFVDIMSFLWKVIVLEFVYVGLPFALAASSGWPLVVVLAGAVLYTAVAAIIALWAPADLIAQDVFVFSMSDLFMLTSGNFPSPPPQSYVTDEGIRVSVEAIEKGASHYLERRKYRCDDEGSEYHLTLRYTREQ
jgi:hypothetical protein